MMCPWGNQKQLPGLTGSKKKSFSSWPSWIWSFGSVGCICESALVLEAWDAEAAEAEEEDAEALEDAEDVVDDILCCILLLFYQ